MNSNTENIADDVPVLEWRNAGVNPEKGHRTMISSTKNIVDKVPVLEWRGVGMTFGQRMILNQQSLAIHSGARVAIIGGSGEGKTTGLHISRGHLQPTTGTVYFKGRPLDYSAASLGQLWSCLPVVSQDDSSGKTIPPYLTALDNVELPFRLRGVSRRQAREQAAILLEQVGLGHRMLAKPGKLSGGERQRVAVARALASDGPMILADEPTAALDPSTSRDVLQLLANSGRSLLIVTHAAVLVAPYVDHVLLLRGGVFYDVTAKVKSDANAMSHLSDYGKWIDRQYPPRQAM